MARSKQTHQVIKDAEKASKGRAAQKPMGRGQMAGVPVPQTHAEPRGQRSQSKQSILVERLGQPEGAGIDELTQALGWLPHTVRAALTGLRRKGHSITRAKTEERGSVYRIAGASPGKKPARASAKHTA